MRVDEYSTPQTDHHRHQSTITPDSKTCANSNNSSSNHNNNITENKLDSAVSSLKMSSTMVLAEAGNIQRPLAKPGGTSFFIRDLLMKDVCGKSDKPENNSSSSPNSSSDDEIYAEQQRHSLARLGQQLYQNGHLPNGLSNYFDHCLSRINQSLLQMRTEPQHHSNATLNSLLHAETYAKLNELTGLPVNEGESHTHKCTTLSYAKPV